MACLLSLDRRRETLKKDISRQCCSFSSCSSLSLSLSELNLGNTTGTSRLIDSLLTGTSGVQRRTRRYGSSAHGRQACKAATAMSRSTHHHSHALRSQFQQLRGEQSQSCHEPHIPDPHTTTPTQFRVNINNHDVILASFLENFQK